MSTSNNNKRIAKNTILLYCRMLLTMAVALFTSRVVLQTLGVEDYGIYNVVGGVVSMFSFLNGAMATSTQRYITFELGKGDFPQLQKVFTTSVNIHALISFAIVVLAETVGLWFLYNKMVIPADRMDAAFWVYQLSILSAVLMIVSVPYNSAIIAHEKMGAFAYISILEVSLKLIIVYLLLLTDHDKLIVYAMFIFGIQLLIRIIYGAYCNRNFLETKYRFIHDHKLFKEMLGFAGWNLWGNLAGVLSTQGVNVLLNMFFGPAVNAARGVAVQVQGAVTQLASNFQTALNPQITKNYAQGDLESMHRLVARSSRFSFFLLFIVSAPIILLTHEILSIWLVEVPEYSDWFLKIVLIISMIDSVANPLMVSAAATGNVKKYQSVVGGVILLVVPLSYVALKMGYNPISVYVLHVTVCIIAFIVRLFIIKPMIKLKLRQYALQLISTCGAVVVTSLPIPLFALYAWQDNSLIRTLTLGCLTAICIGISVFVVGLDKKERAFFMQKLSAIKNKYSR